MELHEGFDEQGVRARLFLDSSERVVVLPTDYIRSLSLSARRYAPGTLALYALRLRVLCQFLEDHRVLGALPVDAALRALDLALIDQFYRHLEVSGLKASAMRGMEAVVRGFTAWMTTAQANRAHATNIYANSKHRTASPIVRLPRYLTEVQVISLLKGMRWESQRLVGHFIFDTGLRVSEVPRVLATDLPRAEDYPENRMYFPLLVRGSKGQGQQIKPRYTIISRAMLSRISRYHRSRAYMGATGWKPGQKPCFLNIYGEPLTVDAIQGSISRARAKSNLAAASPHRLRHGTAYSILGSEHGKDFLSNLLVAQRALGHNDISTTEIYTNIPAPLLAKLNNGVAGNNDLRFRYEEAQKIFEETFIPERKLPQVKRIGIAKAAP